MRRPEGFTSRRRRYLAKKVDRLDRLENRTTMTEPISAIGLLMGSLRWLDQLGIVDKRMLGNPVSGLAPLDQVSAPGQAQAQKPPPVPDSADSIMAGYQPDRSAQAGGGGGGSVPTAAINASTNNADDLLTFNTPSESGSTGIGIQHSLAAGQGAWRRRGLAAARRVGGWSARFQAGGPRLDRAAHAAAVHTLCPHRR